MKIKGFAAIAIILIAVVLAVAGGIWYYEAKKPSSSAPSFSSQNGPRIDFLSPSSTAAYSQGGNGSTSTILALPLRVTIRGSGFTPTGNTVNFAFGPIDNLTSADGRTITFEFGKSQSQLAQCGGGVMAADFCKDIPPGTYSISVSNANGTSNGIPFSITTPAPNTLSQTVPDVVAACDSSEAQGQKIPDLSGGVAMSQSDQATMLETLFKMGLINSTSECESPLSFFTPNGQTYFIISTTTKQQMYRATTTDLLSGKATVTPLSSISGAIGGEDLWIRGFVDGALLYTIVGQSPSTLQAIDPQAGQSLWSFSTGTDINNVLISGDGIFVDFFHTYFEPGFVKIDPSTGKVLWRSGVGTLPALWDDGQSVYVIDNSEGASSTLYKLSNATGKIMAEFPLPGYSNFESIDECGGNLYLIKTGLTPQNGNGPGNDYTRFDPQTGAMEDVGPVLGQGSSSAYSTTTDQGGPGIQF